MSTFESLLARDGKLVYKVKGNSMNPMLVQNRDLVTIQPPAARLKKYDVALYKRGQSYVLHRVIGVTSDAYLIRGDNTYLVEHVPQQAVIGILTGFQRNGRMYSVTDKRYLCYARIWYAVYPIRAFVYKLLAKSRVHLELWRTQRQKRRRQSSDEHES